MGVSNKELPKEEIQEKPEPKVKSIGGNKAQERPKGIPRLKPGARIELNEKEIAEITQLVSALAPIGEAIMRLYNYGVFLFDRCNELGMVEYIDPTKPKPDLIVPDHQLVDVKGEALSSENLKSEDHVEAQGALLEEQESKV